MLCRRNTIDRRCQDGTNIKKSSKQKQDADQTNEVMRRSKKNKNPVMCCLWC